MQPLQQAQRIGRLTDAARLVDDQAFPAGVNNVERRPVELRPLSSFEPCQIVDAFKDGLAGRRRPEGDGFQDVRQKAPHRLVSLEHLRLVILPRRPRHGVSGGDRRGQMFF